MATHFSILAGRISWTEEPGGLQSMVSKESDMTEPEGCTQIPLLCSPLGNHQQLTSLLRLVVSSLQL